jgi:hypothetical protein
MPTKLFFTKMHEFSSKISLRSNSFLELGSQDPQLFTDLPLRIEQASRAQIGLLNIGFEFVGSAPANKCLIHFCSAWLK